MSEKIDNLLKRLTDPENAGTRLCDLASLEDLLTLRSDYYALKTELQIAQNELNHHAESQTVELFVNNLNMERLRLNDTVLWARLHARPRFKTDFGYKFNVHKEFYRVVMEKIHQLNVVGH
ncbi:hypothetical protein CPT_Moby_251 [Stenotrophomonas phage Moby]|uniref:Uncharacterized protein n=1 Tax=Stenotrophomonas phage Moby TaxID=2601680 RepID=A0A5P8PMK1_9CAUD|nr:hypothetical protein HWC58_gp147 [Stenotrophomonas phage Moby]QFR57976.1 hypothetical protein CPT_Moby_251 [Stenotrophomonas phage Moby]